MKSFLGNLVYNAHWQELSTIWNLNYARLDIEIEYDHIGIAIETTKCYLCQRSILGACVTERERESEREIPFAFFPMDHGSTCNFLL